MKLWNILLSAGEGVLFNPSSTIFYFNCESLAWSVRAASQRPWQNDNKYSVLFLSLSAGLTLAILSPVNWLTFSVAQLFNLINQRLTTGIERDQSQWRIHWLSPRWETEIDDECDGEGGGLYWNFPHVFSVSCAVTFNAGLTFPSLKCQVNVCR